jgi:hypothetical protein
MHSFGSKACASQPWWQTRQKGSSFATCNELGLFRHELKVKRRLDPLPSFYPGLLSPAGRTKKTGTEGAPFCRRHKMRGHRSRPRALNAAGIKPCVQGCADCHVTSNGLTQRYTSTGTAEWISTFCVTLPSNTAPIPLLPWEAIKIRSQFFWPATLTRAS